MQRCAITGSRSVKDRETVWGVLDKHFPSGFTLVHGGAHGVDTLAQEWAIARGIPYEVYRPDWKAGKWAGMARNTHLVNMSERVIAIWDGESKGTRDAINKARKQNKLAQCFIPSAGPGLLSFMVKQPG